MEAGLVARVVAVVAAVLVSLWLLTPTLMGRQAQDLIEAAAAREKLGEDAPPPAQPDPWWVSMLPNRKVNLGLDLQGGIDLTLDVDTDEAVLSTVQRDVGPVKALAEREGVKLDDVRRARRAAELLIDPAEGVELEPVQNLLRTNFPAYRYDRTETVDGKPYLVFEMTDEARESVADRAVQQALETIRNRIDETGVKEPSITLKGDRGIDVQLPGETDVEQAVAAVGTTARLEFSLVDEQADMGRATQGVEAARAALPPEDFQDDRRLSEWMVDNGFLGADRKLMWEYAEAQGQETRETPYVLVDEVILSGDDVNDAQTQLNSQTGEWYVALEFKPRGEKIFAQVTGDNVGKRFAIVLDNRVRSAPQIRERISGTASITMGGANLDDQAKEAGMLALVLRSGALPAPVTVGEVRTVGASMGEQAIQEGLLAALLGSVLVFAYAAFYYRMSGVVADITLLLNVLFVLALLALAGATLTLPGICGIALTVGMAVDCNIIFYERIREELRGGKAVKAAIDAGFDRAFSAVIDSNVTTLLAGVVLYSYGSGPIRGFAVTLMIGIVTTLFTGVFVSRTLLDLFNQGRRAQMSI